MIDGLTLEYAQARVGARLGRRPDDALWTQVRAAREVDALLDRLRASPAAPLVSGIAPGADLGAVELAVRQALRAAIVEAAGWVPAPWRPAVLHARLLLDLPALRHLLDDEVPARWLSADPSLARCAQATRLERRSALSESVYGPLLDRADSIRQQGAAIERSAALLDAWLKAWREQWPPATAAERAALDALVRALRLEAADASRRPALVRRCLRAARATDAGIAAVFAWLALLAFDLDRLRAAFVRRALGLAPP